jgi:hypothetical protein
MAKIDEHCAILDLLLADPYATQQSKRSKGPILKSAVLLCMLMIECASLDRDLQGMQAQLALLQRILMKFTMFCENCKEKSLPSHYHLVSTQIILYIVAYLYRKSFPEAELAPQSETVPIFQQSLIQTITFLALTYDFMLSRFGEPRAPQLNYLLDPTLSHTEEALQLAPTTYLTHELFNTYFIDDEGNKLLEPAAIKNLKVPPDLSYC